jgi:DNA-binding transcriptional ArsR family regulator
MARLPTTSDVFNAIAEPQRRHIIDLLAQGELSVNNIANALDLKQPQTSKHLRVLKEVGLVSVQKTGRQRVYRLNGIRLKPVYEWVQGFEHLWSERFDQLETYLNHLQQEKSNEQET